MDEANCHIIPIIRRKRAAKDKLILISLIAIILVTALILLSSEIIIAAGYQFLEIAAVTIILIHLILTSIILISRQEVNIGNLYLRHEGFEISMNSGTSDFFLKSFVKKIKLIIQGYRGQKVPGFPGKKSDGMNNFLIFWSNNKTHIYEFFLNSSSDLHELLKFFNINSWQNKIEIMESSKSEMHL